MKDKRISSTSIDSAFAKDMQPVYVVSRHGYSRRFLSRSAAISNLAHYMVTKTFQRAGLNTNEPDEPVFSNGVLVNRMGQHTQQYLLHITDACGAFGEFWNANAQHKNGWRNGTPCTTGT